MHHLSGFLTPLGETNITISQTSRTVSSVRTHNCKSFLHLHHPQTWTTILIPHFRHNFFFLPCTYLTESHLFCFLLLCLLFIFPTRMSVLQGQGFLEFLILGLYFFFSYEQGSLSSLIPQHPEESLTGNRNSGSFAEWMQTQIDARGRGWVGYSPLQRLPALRSVHCGASHGRALLHHHCTRMDFTTNKHCL